MMAASYTSDNLNLSTSWYKVLYIHTCLTTHQWRTP